MNIETTVTVTPRAPRRRVWHPYSVTAHGRTYSGRARVRQYSHGGCWVVQRVLDDDGIAEDVLASWDGVTFRPVDGAER